MILFLAIGCAGRSDTAKTAASSPLSAVEWKAMPVDKKYEPETIERLKKGDPALETPEGWEAFNRTTLLPSRKKDFPSGQQKR